MRCFMMSLLAPHILSVEPESDIDAHCLAAVTALSSDGSASAGAANSMAPHKRPARAAREIRVVCCISPRYV
ncbi:hypothetical protein D3C77_802440 [compost metagenome]